MRAGPGDGPDIGFIGILNYLGILNTLSEDNEIFFTDELIILEFPGDFNDARLFRYFEADKAENGPEKQQTSCR